MATKKQDPENPKKSSGVVRKKEDLELKKQLLLGPNLNVPDKGSDESLDKLSLKIKLIGGREFTLEEYIAENLVAYESKFFKDWFYELARLFGVDKKEMDPYVKPKFVPEFIINFVYARFPYKVFERLRKKCKFVSRTMRSHKLFQWLSKDASKQLDVVIEQVFLIMKDSADFKDFQKKYSDAYKLHFQVDLF